MVTPILKNQAKHNARHASEQVYLEYYKFILELLEFINDQTQDLNERPSKLNTK